MSEIRITTFGPHNPYFPPKPRITPKPRMTVKIFHAPNNSFQTEYPEGQYGIFLAGPILGAPEWQTEAAAIINEIAIDMNLQNDIVIFDPRRPEFKDLKDFSDDTFFEQVDWEHAHLASAKNRGVRLFWLCNREVEIPGRNYALTTLFELGEAIGYAHDITGGKIVVGVEQGFTNKKYLDYTIAKKAKNVELAQSLEGACYAAVEYVRKQIEKLNGTSTN